MPKNKDVLEFENDIDRCNNLNNDNVYKNKISENLNNIKFETELNIHNSLNIGKVIEIKKNLSNISEILSNCNPDIFREFLNLENMLNSRIIIKSKKEDISLFFSNK